MSRKLINSVILTLGVGVCGVASAQSTWMMTAGCVQAGSTGNFGNNYNCAADAGATANTNLSGWSAGRSNEAGGSATYSLSGTGWANTYITDNGGSGFGAVSRTEANAAGSLAAGSPNHSVDSIAPGSYDFIMVKFDTAQILTNVGIGWGATDSDMTIMRWSGNSAPTTANGTVVGGGGAANLTSTTIGAGGWELVGNFADVCRNASNVAVANNTCDSTASRVSTGATLASSYWLVAAYNTTMGGGTWSTDNDGFKLNYLKTALYSCPGGVTPGVGGSCSNLQVPVPGSLALLAAAGFGLVVVRRRTAAKS
jgi:hypothetical protein